MSKPESFIPHPGRLNVLYTTVTGQAPAVTDAEAADFVRCEAQGAMLAMGARSYARLNFHLERLASLLNYHKELTPPTLPDMARDWYRMRALLMPRPGFAKKNSS